MQTYIALAASAAISALIGAVVAAVVAQVKHAGSSHIESDKAMKDGMKLLLMDKTKYLTRCAVDEGSISIPERAFIHDLVDTAHALGANGEMTACMDEADKLPTKVS